MRHRDLCKRLSKAADLLEDSDPGMSGLLYNALQTIIQMGVELDKWEAADRLRSLTIEQLVAAEVARRG